MSVRRSISSLIDTAYRPILTPSVPYTETVHPPSGGMISFSEIYLSSKTTLRSRLSMFPSETLYISEVPSGSMSSTLSTSAIGPVSVILVSATISSTVKSMDAFPPSIVSDSMVIVSVASKKRANISVNALSASSGSLSAIGSVSVRSGILSLIW